MIDWGDNMDYYSGVPEPSDYDDGKEDLNTGNSFNDFFQKNSTYILIGLAALIVILVIIFFFVVVGSGPEYNTKSDDGTLLTLDVSGGVLEPAFSKEIKDYTIVAESDYITFDCKASHDKAKVEGCDEEVEVLEDEDETKYEIKITAENNSVTRYRFTIIKNENYITNEDGEDL